MAAVGLWEFVSMWTWIGEQICKPKHVSCLVCGGASLELPKRDSKGAAEHCEAGILKQSPVLPARHLLLTTPQTRIAKSVSKLRVFREDWKVVGSTTNS